MKRRIHSIMYPLLLAVCLISFFIYPSLSRAQTPQEYIGSGEDALFSQRIQGILQAYSIFQQAKNSFPNDPVINTYLAVTRILDLSLRTDGTGLTDLLGRYGIVRTGVDLESLDFKPPLTADKLSLPESAPSGETIRSFAAGAVLTALNASISNLDTTIGQWSDESKYIIKKAILDSDRDLEMDYGDIYLFRAGLKAAKAMVLIGTAYDQNVDLREVAALINLEAFNPKKFLDRYQDFLKLLPTATTTGNGATQLNDARAVLLSAIDDYLTASTKIRNDISTTPGAEELIEIEPGDPDEQLLRENMTELKNSLNENRAADLVLERVGTQYHVYGGTSFTTTEPFWWMKGFHPENYGYTFLGSATTTATFNGSYPYYIVVTRPGNVAPVDTVQGSNGLYYGTNTMWNASSWGNIGGPPDNHFGLIGNKDSEGYIVINPPVSLASITVMIVPEGTAPYPSEDHLSVNLNPFFANKPNVRDMLPSFSEYGFDFYPIAGTMGHGLGDDATLGGILPDFTQQDWGNDILATGTLSIPTATIDVQDASVADWGSISPVLTDRTGDGDPAHPGSDLQYLYLAKDNQFLYIRMTLADGPPSTNYTLNPWQTLGYFVQFRTDPYEFSGNRVAQADYPGDGTWRVQVFESDYNGALVFQNTYQNYAQPVGNNLEWKVPLSDMGSITGKTLTAWIKWIPYGGDYDQNHTTLRVGPLSSVSGTLTIPAYDGTGPIYVAAFRHDGTFSTDRDHLVGMTIIYPGQYTAGMTYTVSGLPVGEQVIIGARWDADFNGIKSGGDYLTRSNPLTVASDGTTTANLTATTVYSREQGAPYFVWVNVQSFNSPAGVQTSPQTTVADSDGAIPYTVKSLTVSGPSGFNVAFKEEDYLAPPWNVYARFVDGQPAVGEYTFTLTDENGNSATSYYYLDTVNVIPLPDAATLRAYGSAVTPTLTWSALSNYQGNMFYRARIFDRAGNIIWTSGFTSTTSVAVPSGVLTSGASYQWRLEALDGYTYYVANNRAVTQQIPLVIENGKPYFNWAMVLHRVDTEGDWTQLEVNVTDPNGSVPSSIQSCQVYDPQGNLLYTFKQSDYLLAFHEFAVRLSGKPADGIYRFVVTDTENNTVTTYDYVKALSVPMVDINTLQASGDPLAPTLSWGAPEGMDRPFYFEAIVEDATQGNRIWASYWVAESSVTMPQGVLQQGVSYKWFVRTWDEYYFIQSSNQARCNKVDLAVNNSRVFFKYAAVYKLRDSTGVYTALDASVLDPNGTVPGSIQSLTVTGPGGFNQNLKNGTYFSEFNEFYLSVPGAPQPGLYTFTVRDTEGNTAVSYDYVGAGLDIPLVDNTSILLTGNPLAPTVSWKNLAGYPGHLYYRLRVFDALGNSKYMSSREPVCALTIPAGILQPGESYSIRIEAQDDRNWVFYNSRSNSNNVYYEAPQEFMTGVSGRVTDPFGIPIPNVHVYAQANDCSGQWMGGTNTDQNGNYTIYLPAGTYLVRACATCSGLPYVDEWYGGVNNCNDATLVSVVSQEMTPGIDFALEQGGTLSGHVYQKNGNPIANLHVYASDYNTNAWTGGSNTGSDGSYSIVLPSGAYRVRSCASCNNLSYIDEWYNDTFDYNTAMEVSVTAPGATSGIDFYLEGLEKRPTATEAVNEALAWLAQQQSQDGSWQGIANPAENNSTHALAKTALAVLAFEKHAKDQGKSPLDANYQYRTNVINGLNFIFANAYTTPISQQLAGNPDGDGDGQGVYFMWSPDEHHVNYYTSICAMAIAASGEPGAVVSVANSPVDGWTYHRVLQNVVDFIAYGQTDYGAGRGGWDYGASYETWQTRSDQSNSGWVSLALAYAEAPPPEGFGLAIPGFVRTELDYWINEIQDPVGPPDDDNDGASYYSEASEGMWGMVVLRTGNLLQQMAFVGDTSASQRAQSAIGYIVRHWDDEWQGNPLCYHSSYTTMKGLEALGVETIGSSSPINWFEYLSDRIRGQQTQDGWWPVGCYDDGDMILSTEWAILTLQKAVAPTAENPDLTITDIQVNKGAGSYTVSFTVKNKGNLPALAGHEASLTVNGVARGQVTVPVALDPELTYTGSFAPVTWIGGRNEIKVCADINAEVAELNEENNCSTVFWPPPVPGDMNTDSEVTLADAILALKVVAGISSTGVDVSGDVNGDGKIGLTDAIYILQQNAGLR